MKEFTIQVNQKTADTIVSLRAKYSEREELMEKIAGEEDKNLRKYMKTQLKTVNKMIKVYERKVITLLEDEVTSEFHANALKRGMAAIKDKETSPNEDGISKTQGS